MYFLKFCAFFWLCKNLSSVLRADVGIRPYGVALGECEVVGANCVRPRTVEDARPYGVALSWCEIVGTTIGRPFVIACGDAGRRGRRPLRILSNLGAGL